MRFFIMNDIFDAGQAFCLAFGFYALWLWAKRSKPSLIINKIIFPFIKIRITVGTLFQCSYLDEPLSKNFDCIFK